MRFFVIGAFVFLFAFFGFSGDAHAAYSNDSSSVDINYTGPAPGSIPGGEFPGEEGGGSGTGTEGGGETGGTSGAGSGNGQESGVTITVSTEGSGTAGTGSGQNGEDGSETGEDLLSTLLGHQALSFGLSGASNGQWGTITLSGAKARAALLARGVSRLSIADLLNSRFFTREDFSLVAASKILENKSIEEIILTLDTLTLTYRSDGRLFAVFPFAYPIKLTINPNAETREKRILVKFPWYRFFLQTYVSRAELQTQIDTAITQVLLEAETGADVKTKVLLAVTEAIESRFDTVDGTLK